MTGHRWVGARKWAVWVLVNGAVLALAVVIPCGFFPLVGIGATAQGLVLRRWLPGAADWPLVTAIGIVAGYPFLAWAWFDPANRSDGMNAIIFALFAVVVGAAQWFALRTRAGAAGWWIAASGLGGALFWPTYEAVWSLATALYNDGPHRWIVSRDLYFSTIGYGEPSAASILTWLVQAAAGGAAYGAVTGVALLWLLRDRPQQAARPLSIASASE